MNIVFLGILDSLTEMAQGKDPISPFFCKFGIQAYNACAEALARILMADIGGSGSVSSSFSNAWSSIINGSTYTMMATIAGVFAVVFFMAGYCRESVDLTKISNIEANISLFIRLILSVAAVSQISRWLPVIVHAGVGVALKINIKDITIKESVAKELTQELIPSPIVSIVFGLIFFILFLVCGGGLLFIGLKRLMKMIMYACLAPVMLSTISGGHGINRSASIWLRGFISAAFSNVAILIALCISAKFMDVDLLGGKATTGIFKGIVAAVKVVSVIGFVKGAESIFERLIGGN